MDGPAVDGDRQRAEEEEADPGQCQTLVHGFPDNQFAPGAIRARALFITVMQVQGTIVRNAGEVVQRPLTDLGNLGYVLLVVSGVVIAVRRRWPVPVDILPGTNP
ncbi:hypothetical protein [Nonomuraea phyllanthi]|uniref:hypothetical protein n=1 Tax=Nonomuraea phyllanthi TaxID=2219224 RepID=UPI001D03411A|nr:hypothetical protein [Nonomuraea phyllanthi]